MRSRAENFTLGRLAWRLGRGRGPTVLTETPERPIGAKLEITYACNLRCDFCYTDSPRRTLQRTPELSDEEWRRVVDECLELGIVEAVVTGGEPLLRQEATLGIVEQLAGAGVGVTLNTNGWFVDEEVTERLGALRGVTAHISVDGARAGLHDASRGVPGSWRRAIEGIDRLLGAGVGVCVVHVVTPDNEKGVPELLEQMWTLGVPWVRMTPVVVTGAAARGGDWSVSRQDLQRAVNEFEARHGEAMRIQLVPGTGGTIAMQGRQAPGSFLVRPNGDVRPDSMRPFTFGNAATDGVASCWESLRQGWDDERINRWAEKMKGSSDLPKQDLVAYLDDEVEIAGESTDRGTGRDAPVPAKSPPKAVDPETDLAEAQAKIRELALARRYRQAPLRSTGGPATRFVRLGSDGTYLRLNESGALVMDSLDGGTVADAATELERRYGIAEERAVADAIGACRELQRQRVVLAEGAREGFLVEAGTSDLPGSVPEG
ncbi:MAG TPA: PqqD family peptide modification chaperone [Solirubrobacterales bacterium]